MLRCVLLVHNFASLWYATRSKFGDRSVEWRAIATAKMSWSRFYYSHCISGEGGDVKKKRSIWVRPIFIRRRQQGDYHNLLQEMRLSDPESHFRYLRMSKETFDCLLAKVKHLKIYLFRVIILIHYRFFFIIRLFLYPS